MKPMLASPVGKTINFPIMASPKIDGVRAMVAESGILLSRNMKPIRNGFVQGFLGHAGLGGLDGELVVGDAWAKDVFTQTSSGVMSYDGEPDFTYWVFDIWNLQLPYSERYRKLLDAKTYLKNWGRVKIVKQTIINSEEELLAYESEMLAQGYEGIMVRSMDGPYKFGRSTQKEGILLKVKRFTTDEHPIHGVQEFMHNANAAFTDELGRTTRSASRVNLVGMKKLGAFVLDKDGMLFSVGTGFTDEQRIKYWDDYHLGKLTGKLVVYKHFESGSKNAPRFPVFVGFRDPADLGE